MAGVTVGQSEFTKYDLKGLTGEVYFSGAPGGAQPGYGGPPPSGPPPGNPSPGWGQPNPQPSGSNVGILIAVAGVFVALVLIAAVALFLTLNNDSEATTSQISDTTVVAEPVAAPETTAPSEAPSEPAAPQAVPEGEFALTLDEVTVLPSNSSIVTDTTEFLEGYCGFPVSDTGLNEIRMTTFENPDLTQPQVPYLLSQAVLDFDSPENARDYFKDLVIDNSCTESVYERNPGDTYDHTIVVESPTVYGDETMEVAVNAVGGQTGDQFFFSREFVILDGSYIYFSWLQSDEEFPRPVITELLDKTASNLGLS